MRFNLAKGQCESLWHTLQNKLPDGLIIEIHTKTNKDVRPLSRINYAYCTFHSIQCQSLKLIYRYKLGLQEQF